MSVRQEKKKLKEKYETLLQEEYQLMKQHDHLIDQLDLINGKISTFWKMNFQLFKTALRVSARQKLDIFYFYGLSEPETEMLLDYLENMRASAQDSKEKIMLEYNINFTKEQISAGCPGSPIRPYRNHDL